MFPIYQADIARMRESGHTFASVKLEPVKHRGETWYELHLFAEGKADAWVLVAQKGHPRRFRLEAATDFVAVHLPEITKACITISRE